MKTKLTLSTLALFGASFIGSAQTARVQAIHNCPDPGAATVDVYLDAGILLDDFNYKEASPYINAPTGTTFTLSICPANSSDTTSAIFKKDFTLAAGVTATVVASGGLAETGATAFDLRAYSGMEMATNQGSSEVSVNIIHGSYDAPMVDIYEVQVGAGELAADLSFGDENMYADLPAADFDVQVRTQTGVVAAEFDVDVSNFADDAITVLATGYLDPSSAVGSEPFGLIAVFPNGTVASLPTKSVSPARLQVIHNCAATDAATVDVWLNDGPNPLLDDFEFRTASPFIDAPAGQFFDVSIAGPGSMDTTGALHKSTFILESGKTYIVVASGTIGSGTYAPATPFSLEVIPMARETATTMGNVDALVWHGSTDAPTVDVVETLAGAGTIVDDISYGESQGYLDLAASSYALEIRDETGATTIAKYIADVSGLADQAVVIVASGFISPTDNNNGASFGLWVALPTGGDMIELGNITGIVENSKILNTSIYPNPTQEILNISFESTESEVNVIRVVDVMGKIVQSEQVTIQSGFNTLSVNVSNLNKGYYYLTLGDQEAESAIRFIKQ